ncbi:hypothetical protein [Natrononativus amylolyticus]|uniref:hypothetical protein n=1 Tax=Natrononativus amylolyticus TaxID=2963434 RepID=UPI0020CF3D46|nr:hypothetical protein [Natrononativus amylolyticus]
MDSSTDFDELVTQIRTQSKDAPGSDTDRVTIRSYESLDIDALSDLFGALSEQPPDPSDLVFFLSPTNLERVLEGEDELAERDDLEESLGHPVQTDEGMPDDTILLLDPNAIEGEEIVAPKWVACGTVGTAD